jgi:hypothetical protein
MSGAIPLTLGAFMAYAGTNLAFFNCQNVESVNVHVIYFRNMDRA